MKLVMEYFKNSSFEGSVVSECHEYESKEAFLADFDEALKTSIIHQKEVHESGNASAHEPIIFEFNGLEYYISDFTNYYSVIENRTVPVVKELNEWFDYNMHRR